MEHQKIMYCKRKKAVSSGMISISFEISLNIPSKRLDIEKLPGPVILDGTIVAAIDREIKIITIPEIAIIGPRFIIRKSKD